MGKINVESQENSVIKIVSVNPCTVLIQRDIFHGTMCLSLETSSEIDKLAGRVWDYET